MKKHCLSSWLSLGLLILGCGILLAGNSPLNQTLTVANSLPTPRQHWKNPKLSTPISDLEQAVPQNHNTVAPGQRIAAPSGFSIEKLPKSIGDMVHSGRTRISKDAEVQVYIEVSKITHENLVKLRALGVKLQIIGTPKPDKNKGEVLTKVPTVQGLLPLTMIDQVAALPFVRYIRLPDYGFRSTGSVDTQGDAILQAEQVRSQFGLDGTGVKVGVISDGIGGVFATGCTTCGATTATPSPITLGDLPNATGTRNSSGVLVSVIGGIIAQSFPSSAPNLEPPASNTTSGFAAEGTAMLEIVHDLAPGAQLYFANAADGTSFSFEQAVDFLAANADVVVDDISFPTPPFDGSSAVSINTATALNTDTNPIRGYFTAVGNLAQNHYEGQYVDSGMDGTSVTGHAGDLHLFQAISAMTVDNEGFGSVIADPATVPPGGNISVFLTWNDPSTGSSNDYDLFLIPLSCNGFSSTNQLPLPPCTISGAPLASSTNPQTGTQPPTEELSYMNSGTSSVAVGIAIQNVSNAAAVRTFDMFILGALGDAAIPDHNFNTVSGSVPAQADAGGSPVSVVSVGATDAQTDAAGNPPATVIELYSSQGTTESTPQAGSRIKPDVTATDDVCVTGAAGFGSGPASSCPPSLPASYTPQVFKGTSAASPHGAGIAALLLQSAPCLLSSSTINTPVTARTNLRNFITSTGVPLPGVSVPVPNNIEGAGLIDALSATLKTLPAPNAGPNQTVNGTNASGATVTLKGSATDPDNCTVTLAWSGNCGTATGVNPTVTCPLGVNTETLTASNGGATSGISASSVQITVSDFSITPSQTTASIQPGQMVTYSLTIGSRFGAFTNPVSLACSGAPSLSSCSVSPGSVSPGSGSRTATLTLTTTAPSSLSPLLMPQAPASPLLLLILASLLVFGAAATFGKTSGMGLRYGLPLNALLICIAAAIAACGGGGGGGGGPSNPGTPAGSYTITVTGGSNQLQHSATVTLNVQ